VQSAPVQSGPAQPGPASTADAQPDSIGNPAAPGSRPFDRDFILRNQIVERYIGGRLPLKAAQEFERFCAEHPELLDELGLPERINVALRLLEAGGRALPWEERRTRWWAKLPIVIGTAALALVLAITTLVSSSKLAGRDHTVALLQQRILAQPLDPVRSTRTVTLKPDRTGPPKMSAVTLRGAAGEMADLKIDVSWSQFTAFRLTIDRVDQGRVAIVHNLLRDSNGDLHLELNSGALGPGEYQLTIEGLTWRGDAVLEAWTAVSVAR
jgi:hypothetical protein